MNILHMKYALEVAKAGSINKASETLLIAQPNLSRSIKELESDLGIVIFDRSAKGMVLTPDGEEFIGYAKKILSQIDEVENMYKSSHQLRHKFSISVPRACYISDAFARFSTQISDEPSELMYKETNSSRAISNILQADYRMGIIRYAEKYDSYFKTMLEEKDFHYELVTEFSYVLVMNKNCPLARKENILFSDLRPYVEIAHADPYVPSLSMAQVKKEELPDDISRRIYVFERASELDILSRNDETFMWVSPISERLLELYGLVQKRSPDNHKVYRDVLIYRSDYKLTSLDRSFITELCKSKREFIG